MGCTSSQPVNAVNGKSNKGANPVGVQGAVVTQSNSYKMIINNKSPHIRLDHSAEIATLPISGKRIEFSLNYCYVSQRGYYPTSLGKANQDSYLICETFLGDPSCHLFGIFDGHGECGDLCSYFAAEQLPVFLEKELKAAGGTSALDTPKMESILTKAFVNVNKAMHRANGVDDTLSGTTGITILLKGDVLYVANVGDSRAIIATEVDGALKFGALSNDQTPFRKDERERVKKLGARVMTLEQIEGNEPIHENWGEETGEDIDESGDPPRIWDHTLERPGCAFTRSIGDSVAEACGVFAEPEILTWKISTNDRFAVIASDGVFEFITSQGVIDLMEKFQNYLDAAKHVVAESYRLWLTYDDRTDDITIIILDLQDLKLKQGITEIAASTKEQGESAKHLPAVDSKPVRRVMTKAKRKVISENWDVADTVEFDFVANATPKAIYMNLLTANMDNYHNILQSPEELARIGEMVKANFMFQNLSQDQKQKIFNVMTLKDVTAGELIIKEGADGDVMYIIDRGEFTVHKKDESGVSQLIFTYTSPGAAFGELSLMYGKPRAASVKAKTAGRLWSIGRQAFRAVLNEQKKQGLMDTVKLIPMMRNVPIPQLQRICELSSAETFQKGQVVASMHDQPNWIFCVVLAGKLKLKSMNKEDGKSKKRAENSFVLAAEINSLKVSVVADADGTKLALIPKTVFDEILGEAGRKAIEDEMQSSKGSNNRNLLVRTQSIFSSENKLQVKKSSNKSDYVLDAPVIVLGDFAYIGTFRKKSTGSLCSIKVISKKRAAENKMDTRLLQERKYIVAMKELCFTLPEIVTICQDSKLVMLEYSDVFIGDLSMAIVNQAFASNEMRVFYAACIYEAISCLHSNGLMHRFINSGTVLITSAGIPKLVDLRYAKKMDGRKAFTICGDPLYFAPEIVSQQGYDFGADLWAFGILLFELFEGATVFGTAETEETQLFKAITGFNGTCSFTEKTPASARSTITSLLNKTAKLRLGYTSNDQIRANPLFSGISWEEIGTKRGFPVDLTATVDPSSVFLETDLEAFSSPVFDQF